jgi:DUF4097 and DUF4098 domain-containing protein YvlB
MPTFNTPDPIAVSVELSVGDVRIEAGDRTDTVVEVRPSDPKKKGDVTAAEQTRVDYSDGRLVIKAQKSRRAFSFRGGDSIDVRVALPSGSSLRAEAGVVHLHATGPLGDCRVKAGVGEIRVEEAGPVRLGMGAGDIFLGRATGHTEITNGSGGLHVGAIDGTGVVKNANGETVIGEITGDLRVRSANGKITVDRADATVAAKTAMGDIRLGEVHRGVVVAETGFGSVEVGVADGVAAWLDLGTRFGAVRNELDAAGRPAPGEHTVEVRADSAMGDITVRRSARPGVPTP